MFCSFAQCLFRVVTLAFFWIYAFACLAQKSGAEAPGVVFGQLTPAQCIPTSADTSAEAVVLYDAGDVSFRINVDESWIVFVRHVRILIRRKSAYRLATVQLISRRGVGTLHEAVDDIEGYTYNLENGRVKAEPLNVKTARFTEKATESYWIEKFTMPAVREGSVIEYRYTVRTPFNISRSPQTWRFQRDIPVDWSQYRLVLPVRYPYKLMLSGSLALAVNEAKPVKIYLVPGQNRSEAQELFYAMKNVPVFLHEPFVANEEEYIAKIDFEPPNYYDLNTDVDFAFSWEAIDKRLMANESFGERLLPTEAIRQKAQQLVSVQDDTLTRVTKVYNFVRRTMTWNGEYSIWGNEPKQVMAAKKGDTGDINLMLIAFLRALNIRVNPVILSTRSHGAISEEVALIRKFNCVVAQVQLGKETILLDAADPFVKPGMLPLYCLNEKGRLIDPPNSRFVSLAPIYRTSEVKTARFALDESGEMSGTLLNSFGGYAAWINYKLLASVGKTAYVDAMHKVHNEWQIKEVAFTDSSQSEETFGVTYQMTLSDFGTKAGDRLYLRPMLTEAHTENPFKTPMRQYPIDFATPIDETFTATYELPANFRIEELPKPLSITLPGNAGRFVYQLVADAHQLKVSSRFVLRKSVYAPNEYPALRELYSQLVAKQAEQVVLVKVK